MKEEIGGPGDRLLLESMLELGGNSSYVSVNFNDLTGIQSGLADVTDPQIKHEPVQAMLFTAELPVKFIEGGAEGRIREEAQILAEEMAELRYNFLQLLEQEQDVRRQIEDASGKRVNELETQIRQMQVEAVASEARCKVAEEQADVYEEKVNQLRVALEVSAFELDQVNAEFTLYTEGKIQSDDKLARRLKECEALNESLQNSLDKTLDKASKLEAALEEKELEIMSLLEQVATRFDQEGSEKSTKLQIQQNSACIAQECATNMCRGSELEVEFLRQRTADMCILEEESAEQKFVESISQFEIADFSQAEDKEETAGNMEMALSSPGAEVEDKHICSHHGFSWPVHTVAEMVESITEELTKLYRLALKASLLTQPGSNQVLEDQIKLWSNVTRKALERKLSVDGALKNWGELVVDLLGQSRRDLTKAFTDQVSLDKSYVERFAAAPTKAIFLQEKVGRLQNRNLSEIVQREGKVENLWKKLGEAHAQGLESGKKSTHQQDGVNLLEDETKNLELELEKSKVASAAEKEFLDCCLKDKIAESGREQQLRNVIGGLETKLKTLVDRLNENEKELGILMDISGIDLDAVVAAKLKGLEQKLQDAQSSVAILVQEKAELSSQLTLVRANLEEAGLQLGNQKHAELLAQLQVLQEKDAERKIINTALNEKIRSLEAEKLGEKSNKLEASEGAGPQVIQNNATLKYLQEFVGSLQAELDLEKSYLSESHRKQQALNNSLCEALHKSSANGMELEAVKAEVVRLQNALYLTECKLSSEAAHRLVLEQTIRELEDTSKGQDKIFADQIDELVSRVASHEKLTDHNTLLKTEVLSLHQQVARRNANATSLEARLAAEKEITRDRLMKEVAKYAGLESEFLNLQLSYITLQAELTELEDREKAAQSRISKLELELGIAKDEVFRYEVRLQKNLKQTKEDVDVERKKLEEAIKSQKQMEWFLSRQIEQTEALEREKYDLLHIFGQVQMQSASLQRERDDLRVAYTALARQSAKDRGG